MKDFALNESEIKRSGICVLSADRTSSITSPDIAESTDDMFDKAGGRTAFVLLEGNLGLLISWLVSSGLKLLSTAEEPLSFHRSPVTETCK